MNFWLGWFAVMLGIDGLNNFDVELGFAALLTILAVVVHVVRDGAE